MVASGSPSCRGSQRVSSPLLCFAVSWRVCFPGRESVGTYQYGRDTTHGITLPLDLGRESSGVVRRLRLRLRLFFFGESNGAKLYDAFGDFGVPVRWR